MNDSKSISYTVGADPYVYIPKVMVFNGGEVNIQLPSTSILGNANEFIWIDARIKSSDDLMQLLLVTDALRTRYTDASITLNMPYTPYARQDRVCNLGEALSAKIFATLINDQYYSAVHTMDNHSDVMTALLDNCDNTPVHEVIAEQDLDMEGFVLISPDAGANKKVLEVAKQFNGLPVVRADKVRDTKTGAITGTVVYTELYSPTAHNAVEGKDCLIVDDICDGGRTFIELAKELKRKGAYTVSLWVTHGIFSKGLNVLFESGIDHIYTTNSFYTGESGSQITVFEVL